MIINAMKSDENHEIKRQNMYKNLFSILVCQAEAIRNKLVCHFWHTSLSHTFLTHQAHSSLSGKIIDSFLFLTKKCVIFDTLFYLFTSGKTTHPM